MLFRSVNMNLSEKTHTGSSLRLPKPRNASATEASSTTSSSSPPPPFDSTSSSSSLNLGSILPTPKADSASASAVDEELEDFLRPRDWEIKEAEKVSQMYGLFKDKLTIISLLLDREMKRFKENC